MPKMIFVSLPVADVARATAFYEAIGFEKDPMFSGDHASSMKWSDAIVVMLADRAFFATLTTKPVIDPREGSSVLLALSRDSRAEVDAITEAALAAGGRTVHEPEDEGFIYSRAFEDLDGHGWGPVWMDVAAFEAKMQPQTASA
ncbi:VOC family protein [uncultured Sphingomonas sp.]|uniref:VOC family protein n=1 Tax=uncultured Sphingomonas sp. TaxID=158754 RepID=UPI0035CA59D6